MNVIKYTLKKHSNDYMHNDFDKSLYKLINYIYLNKTMQLSDDILYKKLADLISFPKCLEKKLLNLVEINCLFVLFSNSNNYEKYGRAFIDNMFKLINHDNFEIFDNLNIIINSVQILGRNKRFEESKYLLAAVINVLRSDKRLAHFTILVYYYSLTLSELHDSTKEIDFYRQFAISLSQLELNDSRKKMIKNAISTDIKKFQARTEAPAEVD